MKPLVFLGPTLPARLARELAPELDYQPPARRGDVYRAVRKGARVIGIIDGELDQALPVWHKEILWALAMGARVFGAASMGALRAVELAPFGMMGVGLTYQWFQDGTLEDDDEVVVAMASSEHEYRALSDAMVNIRATIERAIREQVLAAELGPPLLMHAKGLHFAERSYAALRERTRSEPALAAGCSQFWSQLAELRTDVKGADARALLERLRSVADGAAGSSMQVGARPAFELTPTVAWRAFVEAIAPVEASLSETDAALIDAYHRALALELARSAEPALSPAQVQAESEAFRREHRLHDPQIARDWLRAEGLDLAGFSQLMLDQAQVRRAGDIARERALAQLPVVKWLAYHRTRVRDAD